MSERRVFSWVGPPSIELWQDEARTPSGHEYTNHRLVTNDGRAGAVAVGHDGNAVLFVEVSRTGVDRPLLELPRGFGESPKQDPAGWMADAARELQEETGYRTGATHLLGMFVLDSGLYPQPIAAVECWVDRAQAPERTDGEVSGTVWIEWRLVADLVASGAIADGLTLSALALCADRWSRATPDPSTAP